MSEEDLDKFYKTLNRLGQPYNIKFSNKDKKFNTHRAHLAGEYAKTQGKYEEFCEETFKAYYRDSKNLADREVINEIGSKVGLNIEEMNSKVDSGKYETILTDALNLCRSYKVKSIPTFIVNEKDRITAIRDYKNFKKSLLDMVESNSK